MCKTPKIDHEARMDAYSDQQNAFYEAALITFNGDHPKAHAAAVAQIEEYIRKDEMDPRDYWNWINQTLANEM